VLIVFRFDASPAIGGGHAVRCAALAAELSRQGHACGFAANDAGADIAAAVLPDADVLRLSGGDDIDAMKKKWPSGADWLVVDHYGCGIAFEQAAKGWSRKIAVVDDLPTRPHAGDILIDQTLGRREDEYRALVDRNCTVLAGSDYTLLREEFRAHRQAALARRQALPATPRVLISFGASDPGKASLRSLEALHGIERPISIELLVGRLCPHLDEIEAAVRADRRASLVVDPASVAKHFVQADLAIGAPGMTSWERGCLGLPAIVIPVADNQVDNAAALERQGAVTVLPVVNRVAAQDIARAVSSLLDQPERWQAMATAAARIADGDGVRRVSAAMGASAWRA
jgi:UDP-2,4-diacetamido-2,4,6-trideoxy-beta-L-altropyranose hydrolase